MLYKVKQISEDDKEKSVLLKIGFKLNLCERLNNTVVVVYNIYNKWLYCYHTHNKILTLIHAQNTKSSSKSSSLEV